jgi:hypothetical protein
VKLLCQYEIRFKAAIMLLLFLTLLKPWSDDLMAQNSLSLDFFKRINTWPGYQWSQVMSLGSRGFIFAGEIDTTTQEVTGCVTNSLYHGLLILTDTNANVKWAHCYDREGVFYFAGFGSDGEIWAAGYFDTIYGCSKLNDTSSGAEVLKLDSLGHALWYNSYGSSSTDVSDFISTSDGGSLFLGRFNYAGGDIPYRYGSNPFNYNGWLCKLDSAGNIQWNLPLGGSGDQLPESIKEFEPGVYSVLIQTTSTDYMLAGINSDSNDYVPWILQIDSGGHILSSNVVNEPEYPSWLNFTMARNGSINLGGAWAPVGADSISYCNPVTGYFGFILGEIDSNYQFEWCTLNGGTGGGSLYYTCTINDSLIVAAGVSQSSDGDLSRCSLPTEHFNL